MSFFASILISSIGLKDENATWLSLLLMSIWFLARLFSFFKQKYKATLHDYIGFTKLF